MSACYISRNRQHVGAVSVCEQHAGILIQSPSVRIFSSSIQRPVKKRSAKVKEGIPQSWCVKLDRGPQPLGSLNGTECAALCNSRIIRRAGLFHHFKSPVMIVDGKMQYLFDETGRRYLDVCTFSSPILRSWLHTIRHLSRE